MGTTNHSPGLRFRLILGEPIAIGPGKADLLAAIADTGSISAAGRSMGNELQEDLVSHRHYESLFPRAAGAREQGGSGRGGAQLTSTGLKVLALYRAIEAGTAASVKAELDEFASLLREDLPVD